MDERLYADSWLALDVLDRLTTLDGVVSMQCLYRPRLSAAHHRWYWIVYAGFHTRQKPRIPCDPIDLLDWWNN